MDGYRLDATDTIEVYQKGKTWECGCGHGIGTEVDRRAVKCYSCGNVLFDEEAENREFDGGQTELSQFV